MDLFTVQRDLPNSITILGVSDNHFSASIVESNIFARLKGMGNIVHDTGERLMVWIREYVTKVQG